MKISTIPELLDHNLEQNAQSVLFEYKIPPHCPDGLFSGKWHALTAARFEVEVKIIAKFLLSLGLKKGDKLLILARSTYETVLLDFAAQMISVVVAPVSETSSAHQLEHIIANLKPACVYAFSERHAHNLPASKDANFQPITASDLHFALENTQKLEVLEFDFTAYRPNCDDISSILYTSGVDGMQVGYPFTHRDLVENIVNSFNFLSSSKTFTAKRYLSFLSLSHIVPRIFIYACVYGRLEIGITPGIRAAFEDLQYFKPNFTLVVPRVYDSWYREIVDLAPKSGVRKLFYNRALKSARKETAKDNFAKKIQALLGGELCATFSTGQKPDLELLKFFANCGIGAYDCYGLTEVGGIVSMNLPYANKFKTAGRVIPGRTVEIGANNEVIVSGVHTGDFGQLDADGYLTLSGRMRDIIITSSGKKITPEPMQQSLASDPIIDDALIIGENRPDICALIAIDRIHAEKILRDCNLDHDSWEGKVLLDKFVQKAVNKTNHLVSRDEQIRRYLILEDGFSRDDELISTSNRLRRTQVVEKYRDLIDKELY
jgi:long-chain acyl-CoA synthetase